MDALNELKKMLFEVNLQMQLHKNDKDLLKDLQEKKDVIQKRIKEVMISLEEKGELNLTEKFNKPKVETEKEKKKRIRKELIDLAMEGKEDIYEEYKRR